jgi:hypothetical protein
MRTNTNGKQAIAGRAAARKASTEGTGQGQHKGDSTEASKGRSKPVTMPPSRDCQATSTGRIPYTDNQTTQ